MPDRSRRSVRLSPQAEADFADILEWSEDNFGRQAATRYAELLFQALHDIEIDPQRPGVRQRPDMPTGVFTYHLAGQPPPRTRGPRSSRRVIA